MSLQYVRLEGNLFTSDHLARVHAGDKDLGGLSAPDYEVRRRLDDEISEAYNKFEAAWGYFKLRKRVESNDAFDVTHDWVSDMWKALGGGPLPQRAAPQIEGKAYPIRYEWEGVPIHIVAYNQDLEKGPKGDARGNPHSTLQEYVNRREDTLWGILTNGLTLRILRDNANSTRPAYVEFDLKGMMEAQSFAEFGIFWRMCHHTRFFNGADSWLEKWMHESANRGTPARDRLRDSVQMALNELGRGFLKHPKNSGLRERLAPGGSLSPDDYYRQLLRLAYRLIFLFVTEDRGLLLHPDATEDAKRRYDDYYSTRRLRRLSLTTRGTRHHDLYESLKIVMGGLKDAKGRPALGLPALNSDLWSPRFIPDLDPVLTEAGSAEGGYLQNRHLLAAVRQLSRIRLDEGVEHNVDYRNLGSEELGSIYESLLELEPVIDVGARDFRLLTKGEGSRGGERRSTGSHYTPQDLIDTVLDHALDPLLDEAERKADPEKALLELTVCDPTCGSGHFLIAAAHRMAKRLARIRTGDPEPAPGDLRYAVRDVIGRCIYGVDINPMSVELCKVSLWLEAMEPGKPLAFLDHHIKCGNALLGISPEHLEGGIPDEAYKPRAGIDDPEVCNALKAINNEFPISQQTLQSFREDRKRVQETLSEILHYIEGMPADSASEIGLKEEAYQTIYLGSDEYERYKLALDAWCTAFSYAKTSSAFEKSITNIHLSACLNSDGPVSHEFRELIVANVDQNRFFHWPLEFPECFAEGGFRCVIGNPPYLGGTLVAQRLGVHYNNFFSATLSPYERKGDLAATALRRFWQIRISSGRIGMITTNSIGEGSTRANGLAHIMGEPGAAIVAAYTNQVWPGEAKVVVTLIVLAQGPVPNAVLNGQVQHVVGASLAGQSGAIPVRLRENANLAFGGDKPAGQGFILSNREAQAMIAADGRNSDVVFNYLSGKDLFGIPGGAGSRSIICFHDWNLAKASTYALPFAYVSARMKEERASNPNPDLVRNWWRFAAYNSALRKAWASTTHVLVRAEVSETPLFIRRRRDDAIFSNTTIVVVDATWRRVGIFNSQIHEVWYRRLGGSMKNDARYKARLCAESFPMPGDSPLIESTGRVFHQQVVASAQRRGIGFTALWNLVNDPDVFESDVLEIRESRQNLTQAVADAFEMDIEFRFGHYKDQAGRWRYTMSPEAAKQVYLYLVKLNAEQAAAEKAAPASRTARGQATITGPRQVRLGE